jgi:hypothetical protein
MQGAVTLVMTVHCVYVEITLTIVFGSTVVQISGRRDCNVRGFIATFRANSGMLPHLGYDRPLRIFSKTVILQSPFLSMLYILWY